MRAIHMFILSAVTGSGLCQDAKPSPVAELRSSVATWVETMSRIQQEEDEWARDREVLQNYKEGLEKEIEDLKERIQEAETRRQGADKESLDKSAERQRYVAARDELAASVRKLEQALFERLPLFPTPLRNDAKVAQAIEDLNRALALPDDKRDSDVSKRLLTIITLTGEAEKFQQTVHIRPELHRDKAGREFNMQVIYFGLAMAYAVNEDGTLALSGRPTATGWVFEESPQLAAAIQELIGAATGNRDAAFVQLPFFKP